MSGRSWDPLEVCPRPHGRGGFKFKTGQFIDDKHVVPAHTGGADLSSSSSTSGSRSSVPAHTGGADLSPQLVTITQSDFGGPRPHGRGGFKSWPVRPRSSWPVVPAHTGGADLSCFSADKNRIYVCPRPHGRGGFKFHLCIQEAVLARPRPHGRGGFKSIMRVYALAGARPRPHGRGGFK